MMTWYDYLLVIAIAVGGVFTLSLFTGHYPALMQRSPDSDAAGHVAPSPATHRSPVPQASATPERTREDVAPQRAPRSRSLARPAPRAQAAARVSATHRTSRTIPDGRPMLPPPFATAVPTRLTVPPTGPARVTAPRNGGAKPVRSREPRRSRRGPATGPRAPSPQSRVRPAPTAQPAI
jgi:hypothetical protein